MTGWDMLCCAVLAGCSDWLAVLCWLAGCLRSAIPPGWMCSAVLADWLAVICCALLDVLCCAGWLCWLAIWLCCAGWLAVLCDGYGVLCAGCAVLCSG
jgi:hypothetical protein